MGHHPTDHQSALSRSRLLVDDRETRPKEWESKEGLKAGTPVAESTCATRAGRQARRLGGSTRSAGHHGTPMTPRLRSRLCAKALGLNWGAARRKDTHRAADAFRRQ